LDEISNVIHSLGHIARYAYGPLSRLMLTDARAQTTTYTYDLMGRVTSRRDPLGHSGSGK